MNGGYLVLICVLGTTMILGFAFESISSQWIKRVEENMLRSIGARMVSHSHFFQEEPAARHLMLTLGQELSQNGSYDIFLLKDNFRDFLLRHKNRTPPILIKTASAAKIETDILEMQ